MNTNNIGTDIMIEIRKYNQILLTDFLMIMTLTELKIIIILEVKNGRTFSVHGNSPCIVHILIVDLLATKHDVLIDLVMHPTNQSNHILI